MEEATILRADRQRDIERGRVRLERRWDREAPLGEVFTSLAEYLDKCCVTNSTGQDGCRMWRQCRNWWDDHCMGSYADLTLAQMRVLVAGFEKARRTWTRKSVSGRLPR